MIEFHFAICPVNRGGFNKRGPQQQQMNRNQMGGGIGGGMNFNRGGRPQNMNNDGRGGYNNDGYGQGGRDFDRNRAGGGGAGGNGGSGGGGSRPAGNYKDENLAKL